MNREPFVMEWIEGRPALFCLRSWMDAHPSVSAGFTGRTGGFGSSPFDSLNVALHVHDNPATVIHNREQIANTLDIPFEAWTCADQIHGHTVAVITKEQRGSGRKQLSDAIQGTDGMVTNEPGIWLNSFYADCVPLYFLDPVRGAVGIAHAGWKGTVGDIAGETVRVMQTTFGSKPNELLAAIGPSIGMCCYEVDERVIRRVDEVLEEKGLAEVKGNVLSRKATDKAMLNLQELNRQLLIKEGILPIHIELSHLCTSCNTDLFFSHRKEGGKTGRMTAWIGLDLTRGEGTA
jgi:polyphenol oxidase